MMNRTFRFCFGFIFLCLSLTDCWSGVYNLWENSGRFFELRGDGNCRLILKPYYGFLYEEFPDFEYTTGNSKDIISGSEYIEINLKYPGEIQEIKMPCMITSSGLFLDFLKKDSGAESDTDVSGPFLPEGLYIPCGNRDELLLTPAPVKSEVYAWYFKDNLYYRVRYWIADRPAAPGIYSSIKETSGTPVLFPRTLDLNGTVYTCVTLNETEIRHYEKGVWEYISDESGEKEIRFLPEITRGKYVKKHPAKSPYKDDYVLPVFFSSDGLYLSLGNPYLYPVEIYSSDEMAENISAHNSKRRPPVKPLLEPMELDFHWEEVERLRR